MPRLVETLRVPVPAMRLNPLGFTSNTYSISYSSLGLITMEDCAVWSGASCMLLYEQSPRFGEPRIRIIFGQPRLGRKWLVDKLSIHIPFLFASINFTAGVQLAFNFESRLNGVPVGTVQSLTYDVPISGADVQGQNPPLPYEFFSPLEIVSGDTLELEITTGISRALPPAELLTSNSKMVLQLIGENAPIR